MLDYHQNVENSHAELKEHGKIYSILISTNPQQSNYRYVMQTHKRLDNILCMLHMHRDN